MISYLIVLNIAWSFLQQAHTRYPNQSHLNQLHQGYLMQIISAEVMLVILLVWLLLYLISLFLLYRFNPLARFLYLVLCIFIIPVSMLIGDYIQYSLTYPIEVLTSFLDLFILYLIYFSPIREEFK